MGVGTQMSGSGGFHLESVYKFCQLTRLKWYVNGINLNLVGLSQRFFLCTKVTLDLKIFDEGFKINSLKKAQQVY